MNLEQVTSPLRAWVFTPSERGVPIPISPRLLKIREDLSTVRKRPYPNAKDFSVDDDHCYSQ